MINYSYTVLKYRHDSAAGEVLNIGVVIYAQEEGIVGFRADSRYRRLSETFANFDGDMYRAVIARLGTALRRMAQPLEDGLFKIEAREQVSDAIALVRAAWPDQGLGYFAGAILFGITRDLDSELQDLYSRFIASQHERTTGEDRFSDEKLWDDFKRVLQPRGIVKVLQPKSFGEAKVEFQHAYKNELWHVIEPVSLDYVDGSVMKGRVYRVLGMATAVRDVEEFGTLTALVARPRRAEAKKKYEEALRILADMPVKHKIVGEDEADDFAAELEADMRSHGVLK